MNNDHVDSFTVEQIPTPQEFVQQNQGNDQFNWANEMYDAVLIGVLTLGISEIERDPFLSDEQKKEKIAQISRIWISMGVAFVIVIIISMIILCYVKKFCKSLADKCTGKANRSENDDD